MRQRHIPVLFEQRIGGKVRNHHAFAAVGGGPAGAGLGADRFDVQVVPYTMAHTNLSRVQIHDRVNLEGDMVGKYVVRAAELAGLTFTTARPGQVTH